MRLHEFQNTDKELESALVNTLMNVTGDADDMNTSAELSFDAVREIMKNTGYPAFNYDLFKRLYDDGETLKNIVKDFDQEKIVLKTDADAEENPEMDFDDQGSTDKVKQMAKSAMNRRK
jgi:hypothetical protein|tara:strand:- start:831 stop:1187 length:357 start_codon:yes stop_codon:yes gene_type:complete